MGGIKSLVNKNVNYLLKHLTGYMIIKFVLTTQSHQQLLLLCLILAMLYRDIKHSTYPTLPVPDMKKIVHVLHIARAMQFACAIEWKVLGSML